MSTNRIVEQLESVTEKAEQLIKATADDVSEKATVARKRLNRSLETAKETCDALQEKAMDTAKATDTQIRDNPYQTAGIAFGIGVVLGFILGRK